MDSMPTCRVATVQAAPVFMNRQATVDKACQLILEIGRNGAKIAAFPELFVPGYAYWNWVTDPMTAGEWYKRLYLSSVQIPGPEVDALCKTAAAAGVMVVIGVTERCPAVAGKVYNTTLVISSEGVLLGTHRKLCPTFAEKLTYTPGDGSGLRVYDSGYGRVGSLPCGENVNTLARYSLLAQGEKIHVANYVAFPMGEIFDNPHVLSLLAAAHSYEGKLFTLVSCSAMSQEMIDMLSFTPEARERLSIKRNAFSGVFGPDGKLISEGLIDDEGIVYADIDLSQSVDAKQGHDIVGHYNRFDVFDLNVNRTKLEPVHFVGETIDRTKIETF